MHDFPEAAEIMLKYYRHDIMNILQVISGLAQLQKTDKLLAYIRKASDEIQQFGRFIGCGDIRFALIVYESLLKELKIAYTLHVENTVPLIEEDILQSLPAILTAVHDCLDNCDCDSPLLKVRVQGGAIPELWLTLSGEKTSKDASFWLPAVNVARQYGFPAFQEKRKVCFPLDKQTNPEEK